MTTATPRRSLPSSSQAGKDKDFFLISQARNAHPCITPSPKPTPSIVKSFSLYNRRPSAFQHRQDKKRRFYGPRSISDGTPVRNAEKARASTSSSSGLTAATLPRTHDTSTSRDTQSLDYASLHDSPAAAATIVTVNNRNSAPTTQPAINLSTSSNSTFTTPTTMPPTPTVAPGTHSPSSTLPSIQRTPSRFFVHHPLSTTIDSTMPPTNSSPPSPSSPPKPTTTSCNSLSTVLHHSPGNISRRNAVHGRPALPAFATVSSAMLVPEPLRVNVAHRARRQGITTAPLSPPVSPPPPPRLRPQVQLQQQQQASSTVTTGTTGSSSMAFTALTQATTASSSWSSSSAGVSSSSGEAGIEKNLQAAATPRRLLFPPSLTRRAKREGLRGGGCGGLYPFSSSSFLGASSSSSSSSSLRDVKGGKALENGGDGPVVRRKPVSANAMTACSPVRERKMVGEKKKSSASRKGEGSARGESSNSDDVGNSDDSYPEELEKLEREILSLLFPNPGQRYSSSSMSSSSERKLHELGGGAASSVISGGYSDGYMPSNGTTTHPDRPNAPNNLRGPRPSGGPFPTAPPPPLLDPRDEAQMYALMLEEEEEEEPQSEPDGTTSIIPTSDSYARLNQTGWQSKLARKSDDENQTLRQIIRQQRHHQPPSPVSPPSPQLLPLPSPMSMPSPSPPRYRRNTVMTRQQRGSGPPPAMRLPDDPPVRPLQRLYPSWL